MQTTPVLRIATVGDSDSDRVGPGRGEADAGGEGEREHHVHGPNLHRAEHVLETRSERRWHEDVIADPGDAAEQQGAHHEAPPAETAGDEGEDHRPQQDGRDVQQERQERDRRVEAIHEVGTRPERHVRDGIERLQRRAAHPAEAEQRPERGRRRDDARPHSLSHALSKHGGKKRPGALPFKGRRLAARHATCMFFLMAEHIDGAPTVLVVEDDRDLLSVLQRILGNEGYQVRSAQDGESGLLDALDHAPDLVILDVGLPRKNGVEVARELRQRGFRAPMLMLTARSSVSDKVSGLDAGADDYLPKPFEYPELLARVKALLRRATITAGSAVMRVRDLSLDPISRRVERGGREIELTQKEYALLEYLMRNAGRVVSRQMISEHVWKQQVDPLTNVVDVYINYLRRKLEEDRHNPLIHTVRGSGYVLKE